MPRNISAILAIAAIAIVAVVIARKLPVVGPLVGGGVAATV
jgi:uncharacterized protein (DUF697 family)